MPEKEPEFPLLEGFTVDIPNIFLIDDTSVLSVEHRYDEYTDDYMLWMCQIL